MVDSKRSCSAKLSGRVSKGLVDLPQEIISDILSRLPIELILTCRIVCRSWNHLTQDPDFVNLQLSRSNYQPTLIIEPLPASGINFTVDHLLLLDAEHKIKRIPIESMLLEEYEIMCSCSGLLCLSPITKLDPMVIYNPMTRQRMILPSLDCEAIRSHEDGFLRSHEAGLGYDLSTGRYKVVREYKYGNESSRFEILSLGESSWRELSAPHSLNDCYWDGSPSLFWNGALYWKIIKDSNGDCNISILAFDLSEEKFQILSFSNKFSFPWSSCDLLDLDGRLTLVEHKYDTNMMKLWRLSGKKVGDFSLCLEQIYDTHVKWTSEMSPMVISGLNNNGYLLCVTLWKDGAQRTYITRYFPQNAEYWHLDIPVITELFNTYSFRPSLVSPVAASLLP
ncbi:F-box/LRR-repeat/kelch-repeat protein At2g27520-like [Cornus florida]|uniref:F-box/LRR-repeat/kelch-repeat protein At2g27520-like n=1 Tax=Cornus florida TaxID=4283 RepID=UPI002896AFAE|nr:F-box/LRR-repeat/kelch-repeat protein At2g27520-like [Cornus florida]XP_059644703.1 F-box/LRR-repeat/kelch-repeat protein At2g27520-like [Cornus florida]